MACVHVCACVCMCVLPSCGPDDYELCHDMFVRDITSLACISGQKNPPGPSLQSLQGAGHQEGYSSASSASSSQERRKRRHVKSGRSQLDCRDSNTPTEHRKTTKAAVEQKMSEYILQESFESKEIREGDEYQVCAANIPAAVAYVVPPSPSTPIAAPTPELESKATHEDKLSEFLKWGKKQFLQPGMVTLSYLPTAKVALASKDAATASGSGSGSSVSMSLEPVLHYAQRYCVVVSPFPSTSADCCGGDAEGVVVYDGMAHHVVRADLCCLMNPPMMSLPLTGNSDRPAPPNEMKMINLAEIYDEHADPRKYVLDLCSVSLRAFLLTGSLSLCLATSASSSLCWCIICVCRTFASASSIRRGWSDFSPCGVRTSRRWSCTTRPCVAWVWTTSR
jgi:hypothetical protein